MTKVKAWLARFFTWLEHEPATAGYSLAAALVPVLVAAFHWDARQAAAAAAIGTALASALAAVHARPVSVPVLVGGATAVMEALAAWHVVIPAATMTMVTSALTAVLALLMRGQLTTRATIRQRKAAAARKAALAEGGG